MHRCMNFTILFIPRPNVLCTNAFMSYVFSLYVNYYTVSSFFLEPVRHKDFPLNASPCKSVTVIKYLILFYPNFPCSFHDSLRYRGSFPIYIFTLIRYMQKYMVHFHLSSSALSQIARVFVCFSFTDYPSLYSRLAPYEHPTHRGSMHRSLYKSVTCSTTY